MQVVSLHCRIKHPNWCKPSHLKNDRDLKVSIWILERYWMMP
jgi:hypothetical protein